jgi:small redox-active disulfide protein 2
MVIKVLGTGCAKCKATIEVIGKVAKEINVSPTILKVEDIQEIMKYNVLSTPVVVVDEVVKIKGKVPTMNEVRELLQGA